MGFLDAPEAAQSANVVTGNHAISTIQSQTVLQGAISGLVHHCIVKVLLTGARQVMRGLPNPKTPGPGVC